MKEVGLICIAGKKFVGMEVEEFVKKNGFTNRDICHIQICRERGECGEAKGFSVFPWYEIKKGDRAVAFKYEKGG